MRGYTNNWLKHSAMLTIISAVGFIAHGCSSSDPGTGIATGISGSSNTGNVGNTGTGGTGSGFGGTKSGFGGSSNNAFGGSSNTFGGSSNSSSSGGVRTTGGGTGTSATACQGLPFNAAATADDGSLCTGFAYEAEPIPVDMFIIMDSSISMGKPVEGTNITRWAALQGAVRDFVGRPEAANVGAGIGFFPRLGYDEGLDCDAGWYAANPHAPIVPLSSGGQSIVTAMEARIPDGLTPTRAALEGAIQYARNWALGHRGRATVVVFVSDGFPTMCEGGVLSLTSTLAAAKAGLEGSPSIRTFVIGLGSGAANLTNVARSGGTNQAYLVDFQNISTGFVDALLNITNSKVGCEFDIPEPTGANMVLDPEKVQFVYNPVSGAAEQVPKIESAAACGRNPNGGWYYDNPASPSRILVCPCTCSRLQAGTINVNLGCKPDIGLM